MSRLKELINKAQGVLEEIGEVTDTEEDMTIKEAYREAAASLEKLNLAMKAEERRWKSSSRDTFPKAFHTSTKMS